PGPASRRHLPFAPGVLPLSSSHLPKTKACELRLERVFKPILKSAPVQTHLAHALTHPIATAQPCPLAWARQRLFDDRPSMNIDVGRRSDASPEHRIGT